VNLQANGNAALSDLDAERSVLGAVLVHSKLFVEVAAALRAEDFYLAAHRVVFEAMTELDRDSKPIDSLTVASHLRATDTADVLRSLGGDDYLVDLMASVVTTDAVAYHSRAIALKAQRRRWLAVASEIRANGLSGGLDDEYIAASERALLELTTQARNSKATGIKPIMHTVATLIEQRWLKRNERAITGIPSGLEDLDALTSGWQPSDLVILAGRPSMGKTAAALACADGAAKTGTAVLVFSLEMSKESLVERLVAMNGNIDSMQLRSGHMPTQTFMALSRTFGRLAEYPLWIDDQAALRVGEIRSRARRWRMNEAAKFDRVLVIVDYIGLAHSDRDRDHREREVAEVSAGLKALAKELKAPVIALSQLNRKCEERTDKRPMLSDLRESGAVEQDADVIAFLYRDEVYNGDRHSAQCDECQPGVAEIIVAKQRNGMTGTIHAAWNAPSTKFSNLSRRKD
jgi:replicative DNA helicase